MSRSAYLIAGGGIAGLMAALRVAQLDQKHPVYVIERSDGVGGLLRGVPAGPYGEFDQGMHTFPTSGDAKTDELVESMLPEEEWIYLKGRERDISGLLFQGRLQRNTHYPDLNLLPDPLRQECIADFFLNLKPDPLPPAENMWDYAAQRFGPVIAQKVIAPILENMYGHPLTEIDPVVAKVLPFDRITLVDEPAFRDLAHSPLLRSRMAYPEQRNLNLKYSSGHYSLYPKKFGAHRLVAAIVERLRKYNVTILTRAEVKKIELARGKVTRIEVAIGAGAQIFDEIEKVYWTAGMPALAKLLNLSQCPAAHPPRRYGAIVHLLVDQRPEMGDLYYYWGFDLNYRTFRVTSFVNYCPQAAGMGGYPLSVELFLDAAKRPPAESLFHLARRELNDLDILDDRAKVLHHVTQALPVGFPVLSVQNKVRLKEISDEINRLDLGNLHVAGMLSQWGVVLQPDVVRHALQTVDRSFSAGGV